MSNESTIWIEKYRPQTFDQVKGQQKVVERVKAFVEAKNVPHLLFSGPAGVGKCVTAETPILTGDGRVLPISEAYTKKTSTVMSLQKDGSIQSSDVAYFYRQMADELYEITTRSGAKIKATSEHPFLTLQEGVPKWVEAKELTKNDYVGKPTSFSPKITQQKIAWEKLPSLYMRVKDSLSYPIYYSKVGIKSLILKKLFEKQSLSKAELQKCFKNPNRTISDYLNNLINEGLIIKKDALYSLKKRFYLTDIIPYDESVNATSLIYRPFSIRDSQEISYIKNYSPNFMEWLGMVYGDGNVRNSGIRFYNKNMDLITHFTSLSKHLFGNVNIVIKEDKSVFYAEIRKCTIISKILEHIFSIKPKKKSHLIEIPSFLYSLEDKAVSAFIRGYFECDGSFTKNTIEFSSASKSMLDGLSYLFLRFGIYTSLQNKKSQYYLTIRGSDSVREFARRISPRFKRVECIVSDNTNIDIVDIDLSSIKYILSSLGITYEDIGKKGYISSAFEKRRASRKKVQKIYGLICELAQQKLELGLEYVGSVYDLENVNIDFSHLLIKNQQLKIAEETGIDSDRLTEYSTNERVPFINNTLKILRATRQDETLEQISQIFVAQKKTLEIINSFGFTFKDIAKAIGSDASSTKHYLSSDSGSLQLIQKVPTIVTTVKNKIKALLHDELLIDSLERLSFMASAHLRWDAIRSVKKIPGDIVYDLNVHEVHNFIGGNTPTILHNTTLSLVIAKQLFGENWRQNTLELNASDERGIDIVRTKVKDFARFRAIGDVPFKIIYLDECDALTRDAQQALRRTMEQYASTTRFILSCNYVSKIIDPIQSRCTVFKFQPLSETDILDVISGIEQKEGLTISDEAKNAIYTISKGDCRRVENILQSSAVISKEITPELIYSLAAVAKPDEVKKVLELALQNDFLSARNILLDTMLKYGLAGSDMIKQMQQAIWDLDLPNKTKVKLIDRCGDVEFRMTEGSDEFLQLESFLAFIALQG